jgi:predicted ATPase
LAILSILNSETLPPIVFIEEIENELDPRTLNLLAAEMRGMLPEHQFIVTTHSPYFLDLVDLRHVVVAERKAGNTEFYRPDDDEKLNAWKEKFSAGDL